MYIMIYEKKFPNLKMSILIKACDSKNLICAALPIIESKFLFYERLALLGKKIILFFNFEVNINSIHTISCDMRQNILCHLLICCSLTIMRVK